MNKEIIEIRDEFITLDNLLKFSGIAETGGEAKLMVIEGYVSLNGEICTQRKKKIYKGDKIQIDDVEIQVK
ncbi:MAG: RNA-binding S4 domain-containing protein [Oscillospiraceae bacterium]|nr:RNA-binding S4 domain-containing protein [Oscillospiraceae bacterium]